MVLSTCFLRGDGRGDDVCHHCNYLSYSKTTVLTTVRMHLTCIFDERVIREHENHEQGAHGLHLANELNAVPLTGGRAEQVEDEGSRSPWPA